ncbi:MAG: hypothetical protein AVDCRST_MAG02-2752, partial [uncultured Rubrobacteraceae bacterium]
ERSRVAGGGPGAFRLLRAGRARCGVGLDLLVPRLSDQSGPPKGLRRRGSRRRAHHASHKAPDPDGEPGWGASPWTCRPYSSSWPSPALGGRSLGLPAASRAPGSRERV